MSETYIFMTHQDTVDFARFLVDKYEACFVLDEAPQLRLPEYKSALSIADLLESSEYAPRFYVISPIWQKYPLSVSNVTRQDGGTLYYIDQRYGGPAFDFKTCHCSEDAGTQFIIIGWFTDYPWYIVNKEYLQDESKYRTFDRPESMTQAHKEVRNYCRKNGKKSICIETGRPGPWILSGAIQAHAKGTWLRQGDRHFEPKNKSQPVNPPDPRSSGR